MKCLTFALLLFSFQSFAQNKFAPGYIVKHSGDTIMGYLQEEVRMDLLLQVKFKTDVNGSSGQSYTPSEIKAFKYESGNLYNAVTFTNTLGDSATTQTIFALLLVQGENNLFSYIANEKTYFIVSSKEVSSFLYDADYDNNGYLKNEGNYVSRLAQIATACSNTKLNPENVRFNEKEIANFIFDVNHCLSPNTTSINNYKKPKTIANVVLFAGALPLGKQSQLTLDAALRFNSPQISKKAFLSIGFHFAHTIKIETTHYGTASYKRTATYTDFSVPLTLQYNFFDGPIRPYITVGFGVGNFKQDFTNDNLPYFASYEKSTNQFEIPVIGALGIEANVYKGLFIKAEWRYEFLLQLPAIGLSYNF